MAYLPHTAFALYTSVTYFRSVEDPRKSRRIREPPLADAATAEKRSQDADRRRFPDSHARACWPGPGAKSARSSTLTRKLVRAESPSDAKSAVDACVALAAAQAKPLGGRVKLHRQQGFGDVLEARFGPKPRSGESAKRILLLGHLDTVWPLGTSKTMPCRLSGGRLWGPGTLDMKAGVAMALTALEMLDGSQTCCAAKSYCCSTATKRSAVRLRVPSSSGSRASAPPFTCWSRRRGWPTRRRARASAIGRSR